EPDGSKCKRVVIELLIGACSRVVVEKGLLYRHTHVYRGAGGIGNNGRPGVAGNIRKCRIAITGHFSVFDYFDDVISRTGILIISRFIAMRPVSVEILHHLSAQTNE